MSNFFLYVLFLCSYLEKLQEGVITHPQLEKVKFLFPFTETVA